MARDIRAEYVACGSIQGTDSKVDYLEWVEMVLKEERQLSELIGLIVPEGTLKITGSTSRFTVVESWTFELQTGELVRIHWHTPDLMAPAGSNSSGCATMRIQVDSEFVAFDGSKVTLCLPPRSGGDETAWNNSHIPITARGDSS